MTGVVVLGSTGSVGRQALEVVRRLRNRFRVVGIAAGRNSELLAEQAREFEPEVVCVGSAEAASALKGSVPPGVLVGCGRESIEELACHPAAAVVVAAIGGFDGLRPCLAAARSGKRIAMASKEALVVAGEMLLSTAKEGGAQVIPVDSEHSAVFQCIEGRRTRPARIILTASGGPFRSMPAESLASVTPADALRHPNWRMGAKVTVDSATLMNKGLEVIEAHVLFGVPYDLIDVVIHPQSIVHSMVEMADGSVLAQMAVPDMRLPIAYAMTYPEREPGVCSRLDLPAAAPLTFERPDTARFPALALGYRAGRAGGLMRAVLSAADEVAVERFLAGAIPFTAIPRVIECVMDSFDDPGGGITLEAVERVDRWARAEARRACEEFGFGKERG